MWYIWLPCDFAHWYENSVTNLYPWMNYFSNLRAFDIKVTLRVLRAFDIKQEHDMEITKIKKFNHWLWIHHITNQKFKITFIFIWGEVKSKVNIIKCRFLMEAKYRQKENCWFSFATQRWHKSHKRGAFNYLSQYDDQEMKQIHIFDNYGILDDQITWPLLNLFHFVLRKFQIFVNLWIWLSKRDITKENS